jgi:dTMP kinase
MMSLFITFEGGDGSGKSTQVELLFKKMQILGVPAILTREPGGTPLGEHISDLLKWSKSVPMVPVAELLLFNASRAQLVETIIRPALAKGVVVICDRFTDSTIAYQSYGRGIPVDTVEEMNSIATGGLQPDLTILVDVPVTVGFGRKKDNKKDRFEDENIVFHERVRNGYLALAQSEPERFLVIDGTTGKDEIAMLIWKRVKPLLPPEKIAAIRQMKIEN